MGQAVGESEPDYEHFRRYLMVVARNSVRNQLQSKIDISGIVNETLYEASTADKSGRSPNTGDEKVWLTRILKNNLNDQARRFKPGSKRDVNKERDLRPRVDDSAARLEVLVAEQTSPSQGAARNEDAIRLADALNELPDKQRDAIELSYFEGCTQIEIAERMNCTRPAVAGLLRRGTAGLRRFLTDSN